MNETLNVIAKRYSCRAFTQEMPADEQLMAIARAAIAAPSGMNRQAWRVIVVKNQALLKDMEAEGMRVLSEMEDKSMYARIMARGGTLFYHAPCMIIVPIQPEPLAGVALDCGILCQNVALAATSLGLGNLICGLTGLAFAKERAEEFKQRLGFPEGYEFGASVLIGHAAETRAPHVPDETKISVVG